MGFFFVDQYDLYRFIMKDVPLATGKLSDAVRVATGEDLTQDIKDSCTTIAEHGSLDSAFEEVESLCRILKNKIGIVQEISA